TTYCHSLFPHSFFFNDTASTEIYTLSLHDALPIFPDQMRPGAQKRIRPADPVLPAQGPNAPRLAACREGGRAGGGAQHHADMAHPRLRQDMQLVRQNRSAPPRQKSFGAAYAPAFSGGQHYGGQSGVHALQSPARPPTGSTSTFMRPPHTSSSSSRSPAKSTSTSRAKPVSITSWATDRMTPSAHPPPT